MEEKKRTLNKDYPERISHYEDAAGKTLLEELARRRGGLSLTAMLRQLTREEARRVGLVRED